MPQVVLLVLWPVIYLALYLMYMCMSVRALRQHSWIHHRVSGSLVRLQVHSLPSTSSLFVLCTAARCLLVLDHGSCPDIVLGNICCGGWL